MIQGLNRRTKKIETTLGVLGQDHEVRVGPLLNMQDAPRSREGQFLSGQGATLGSLPRQPVPNTIQYLRTPKEDLHAGMRPPEPVARGHPTGVLTDVPLSRLPSLIYTYR
jgi:hypothetical protein